MYNKYSPIHRSKKVDYANPSSYFENKPTSTFKRPLEILTGAPKETWGERGRDDVYVSKECRVESEAGVHNEEYDEQDEQPRKRFRIPPLFIIVIIFMIYRFFTQ